MKTEQKKLPKSQIEITFELTAEEFKEHANHALEHLKHHVKIDGFRQGKAPAKLVEEKIKPEALLMEAGDHAVQHVYSDYILQNKLEPIGQPEVSIIKIANGSEFIFKAVITILPEVELPNYKEIAIRQLADSKGKEISVDEKEVEDALNYLRKTRAKFIAKNEPAENKDFVEISYQSELATQGKEVKDQFILGEGGFVKGFEDGILGMKAGEEKEISVAFPKDYHGKDVAGKDVTFKVKVLSLQKMELPEINDEFAKQLGVFDSLVALKNNMKEGLTAEKKEAEKQRKRGKILEKISEKTKIELPEAMVEYEKQNLLEDLKNKISQNLKITFEQYLSSVKKTEKEIAETFQKEAEKRLRGFLVLREIGKKENIEISEEEVEEELKKVPKNEFDINQLKEYTKGVLFNEKVFKLLEECQ